MGEILTMFCQKIPGTIRKNFQLSNKLKTLKKEFLFLRRMTSRSGWSWNNGLGMLTAPLPEILKHVFEIVGQHFKYFETKKFPYFAKMEELMGGRQQTGDERDSEFHSVQVSVDSSRTGSSNNLPDDSDEGPNVDGSVQQVNLNLQGFDSSTLLNGSSDSHKRNNTESGEPLTRGKRVQLALKERRNEIKEMNMTGKELKEILNELKEIKKAKHNEMDNCYQKLDDLNVTEKLRYLCVEKYQFSYFRKYFLRATWEQILDHFKYEMNPLPHGVNIQQPPQVLNMQFTQPQGPNMQFTQPQFFQHQFTQHQPTPSQGIPPSFSQSLDSLNFFSHNPRSPTH